MHILGSEVLKYKWKYPYIPFIQLKKYYNYFIYIQFIKNEII